MLLNHGVAVSPGNDCKTRLILGQSWESSDWTVVACFDPPPLCETGFGSGLWTTASRPYRTFMLWRQKAAGGLPGLRGSTPLSSNLLGGFLEVCHGEVGGWRVSE